MVHHAVPDHARSFARILVVRERSSYEPRYREWKHYHAHTNSVIWQEGYFDHRLRDDERGEQLLIKVTYIRNNPVAAGLCAKAEDWPWVIDPHA
jgi:hypothetical protein